MSINRTVASVPSEPSRRAHPTMAPVISARLPAKRRDAFFELPPLVGNDFPVLINIGGVAGQVIDWLPENCFRKPNLIGTA